MNNIKTFRATSIILIQLFLNNDYLNKHTLNG